MSLRSIAIIILSVILVTEYVVASSFVQSCHMSTIAESEKVSIPTDDLHHHEEVCEDHHPCSKSESANHKESSHSGCDMHRSSCCVSHFLVSSGLRYNQHFYSKENFYPEFKKNIKQAPDLEAPFQPPRV